MGLLALHSARIASSSGNFSSHSAAPNAGPPRLHGCRCVPNYSALQLLGHAAAEHWMALLNACLRCTRHGRADLKKGSWAISWRCKGAPLGPGFLSFNQSINYTFPAVWLGVSKEIMYFCPPSLSILSQPCPRWQDPKGIQILSDIICPHFFGLGTRVWGASQVSNSLLMPAAEDICGAAQVVGHQPRGHSAGDEAAQGGDEHPDHRQVAADLGRHRRLPGDEALAALAGQACRHPSSVRPTVRPDLLLLGKVWGDVQMSIYVMQPSGTQQWTLPNEHSCASISRLVLVMIMSENT